MPHVSGTEEAKRCSAVCRDLPLILFPPSVLFSRCSSVSDMCINLFVGDASNLSAPTAFALAFPAILASRRLFLTARRVVRNERGVKHPTGPRPSKRDSMRLASFPRFRRFMKVLAVFYFCAGLALFIGMVTRIALRDAACEEKLGSHVWNTVDERIFFGDGFFCSTSCGFEHVRDLNLSGIRLDDATLDRALLQLTSLVSLGLSSTGITVLPPSLAKLTLLETVGARDNPIRHVPVPLAAALCGAGPSSPPLLSRLVSLDLLGTPVDLVLHWSDVMPVSSGSPPHITKYLPRLRRLLLAGNALTSVPVDMLAEVPELESLDLSRNRIQRISPELGPKLLPSLRRLNLSSNYELSDFADGWLVLGQWSTLEMLDLSGLRATIPPPGAMLLENNVELHLESYTGPTVLHWDGFGLSRVHPALWQLSSVNVLRLEENSFVDIPLPIQRMPNLLRLLMTRNFVANVEVLPDTPLAGTLRDLQVHDNMLRRIPNLANFTALIWCTCSISGSSLAFDWR